MHVWATERKWVKVDGVFVFCLNLGYHFLSPIRNIVFATRRFNCFLLFLGSRIFVDVLLFFLHPANHNSVVVVQTVDVHQKHSKSARALVYFKVREVLARKQQLYDEVVFLLIVLLDCIVYGSIVFQTRFEHLFFFLQIILRVMMPDLGGFLFGRLQLYRKTGLAHLSFN